VMAYRTSARESNAEAEAEAEELRTFARRVRGPATRADQIAVAWIHALYTFLFVAPLACTADWSWVTAVVAFVPLALLVAHVVALMRGAPQAGTVKSAR
jgi:hypothetical protein